MSCGTMGYLAGLGQGALGLGSPDPDAFDSDASGIGEPSKFMDSIC